MHIAGTLYLSLVAAVLIGLGLREVARYAKLWLCGIRVEGTIMERKMTRTIAHHLPQYHSVVAFETPEGEVVLWEGGIATSSRQLSSIDQTVTLRYLPGLPQKAMMWTLANVTLPPLALLVLGGVALWVVLQR
jgi:hypothetical protein